MLIAFIPVRTPPPPPIVQNCEYQVEVGNQTGRTYQCFSKEAYQKRVSDAAALEQKHLEEAQAWAISFLSVWWHDVLILLGLIIFAFIATGGFGL